MRNSGITKYWNTKWTQTVYRIKLPNKGDDRYIE